MNRSTSGALDYGHWGSQFPKVSCLCPTYGRPHILGEAIESFLRQDYPGEKELIVLNDHPDIPIILAPQSEVRIVDLAERCGSLGEKRNMLAELATGEVFLPWDDDNISLPWRISLTVSRMTNRHYFRPADCWWWTGTGVEYRKETSCHAMAGYSRELFQKIGGYPAIDFSVGELFEQAVHDAGFHHAEELGPDRAFYLHRLNAMPTFHLSDYGLGGGWEECARYVARQIPFGPKEILPGWKVAYDVVVARAALGYALRAPVAAGDQARILIGICSCHANREKQAAVRETWLVGLPEHVSACFFVGRDGADPTPSAADIIVVDAPDDYINLPAKVIAFFRHALEHFEFDYLFKCDDDTYVASRRLRVPLSAEIDLIGNEFIDEQGFASGGAGYFLSRRMVEEVVNRPSPPVSGLEDVLITGPLIRDGAQAIVDRRLRSTGETFPRQNNDLVTAHWCSPERMRAIHAILHSAGHRAIGLSHFDWEDGIEIHADGHFIRASTCCGGRWVAKDEGRLELQWFDGGRELIRPASEKDSNSSADPTETCHYLPDSGS